MKVGYLDAFSGLAGDMMVGALLDAGLALGDLEATLGTLDLGGYRLRCESRERFGIQACKFVVEIDGPRAKTGEGHDPHRHPHRSFRDVRDLIRRSGLSPRVAELSLQVFARLAEAEGKVHGVEADEVTFHEVGAVDSIVDIVGTAWGVAELGLGEIVVSPLPLGSGIVRSQHGPIPVPGPATTELLRGFAVRPGDGQGEMVTPTGAAIVAALARPGTPPEMRIERVGYGAGDRELADRPNFLRLLVGTAAAEPGTDSLLLLEANLDDLNPEIYDYAMERLFAAGARDVYLTATQMKKNRPGVMISVLCDPPRREALAAILFSETTTLGVRVSPVTRLRIEREMREVQTRFGRIRVKVGRGPDGSVNVAPEYEDCKRIAAEANTPLKTVYQEAIRATLA